MDEIHRSEDGQSCFQLRCSNAPYRIVATAALIFVIIFLRVVALRSDSFIRLDWSAGQMTDEGFYVHNARNMALFGHPRTDGFNNMLLAPVLHYVQTAVFLTFGFGTIQARSISVACSLLGLLLFYMALKRAFNPKIALMATALLGCDHTVLLFNRMALMDTPAMLGAIAAFYAFVRGVGSKKRRDMWLAICGLALGLTVVNRTLCLFLLPSPFLAFWLLKRHPAKTKAGTLLSACRQTLGILTALGVVFILYAVLWYLPNRREIGAMTHYYRVGQIQPSSVKHACENLTHALFGDFRGFAPYLFRHTPAVFGLVALYISAWLAGFRRKAGNGDMERLAVGYLFWWMAFGWTIIAFISYSPARYYVSIYPALYAFASIAFWSIPDAISVLAGLGLRAIVCRSAFTAFIAFHATLAIVHYGGVLTHRLTDMVLFGVPFAATAIVSCGCSIAWLRKTIKEPDRRILAVVIPILIWTGINAIWLADWMTHIDYSQYNTSIRLARTLPSNSVLIGDVAPALCMDNSFVAVNVIPKLCNYRDPVGTYSGRPRFIAILNVNDRPEPYWAMNYPQYLVRTNRIANSRVLKWTIGIYDVDGSLSENESL